MFCIIATSNQKDCILSDDIGIIMILEYRYVYHELLYVYGKKDHGKVSPQTHIIPKYVICMLLMYASTHQFYGTCVSECAVHI